MHTPITFIIFRPNIFTTCCDELSSILFFFNVRFALITVVKDKRPSNLVISFKLCTKKCDGSTVKIIT